MKTIAITLLLWTAAAGAADKPMRVAVAGSEPFVVESGNAQRGIAAEIWRAAATRAGWKYEWVKFPNVPQALDALAGGEVDAVVGPVSITAERARRVRFSQPYFQSSLAILSLKGSRSLWQRIEPFFSRAFFTAAAFFLFILAGVGTVVWAAERKRNPEHFGGSPWRGIANGIWFAIVTMSTVGYGDLAPRTVAGRVITGVWILISIVAASSLVAGIASTLTLTGLGNSSIASAEQMSGKQVAVLEGSPGESFAARFGARLRLVSTFEEGYELVMRRDADAFVFDRPQLAYFLRERGTGGLTLSAAEYERQNYGFVLPLDSPLTHALNVNLLELRESGEVDRIARRWLGE